MKKTARIILLSLPALAMGIGVFSATGPMVRASADDQPTIVQAGRAYTCFADNWSADNLYFNMEANDAPYEDWAIRYRPLADDCVTITRDGVTRNIATNRLWDMIVKVDEIKYDLVTWMMGDYKPKAGDIYTIKGDFISNDTRSGDPSDTTGKYTLRIEETSFVVSKNEKTGDTYFSAIPNGAIDVQSANMPPYPDQQWHFLVELPGLSESDLPVTGDATGYYPVSADCFYVNGKPAGKINKMGLKRRDVGSNIWYVCNEGQFQNLGSDDAIGTVTVIDGMFVLDGNQPNRPVVRFNELAFLRVEDDGHKGGYTFKNGYRIINLREHLASLVTNGYDVNNYKEEDQITVGDLINGALDRISAPTSVKGAYAEYNAIVDALDAIEMDPDAAAAYLAALKESAIAEISSYADLTEYFPEQQTTINGIVSSCVATINAASTKKEISDALFNAKAQIDAVKKRAVVMVEAVQNQTPGYEEYLDAYDVISLEDLNVGESLELHGGIEERKSDLNTNALEQGLKNTFGTSADNPNGNVIFQFRYHHSIAPEKVDSSSPAGSGANLMVNLRGIPYYGYKFAVGTGIDPNNGKSSIYANRLAGPSDDTFLGGGGPLFTIGETYDLQIGALDLTDIGKTWVFAKVNGVLAIHKVVDTIEIGNHPRVALSPNDSSNGATTGSALIENLPASKEGNAGIYAGRLVVEEGHEDARRNLYATLDENALPSSRDKTIQSYPTSASCVKLTRNGVETSVAKTDDALIAKYSDTQYQVYLSRIVDVQDGDSIVISGRFVTYDEENHVKILFTLARAEFVYHQANNSWEPVVSLAEAKEDAIAKIEAYADLGAYDAEEREEIESLITNALAQVNNATTVEQVASILETFRATVDEIPTSLRKAKNSAKAEIEAYLSDAMDNYRPAEQQDIADLKVRAIADVEAALTIEEIQDIVTIFKSDADEVKTKAQYEQEELEEAKREGIQTIQNHYASLDLASMSAEERRTLDQETTAAIAQVRAAESIAEINMIVSKYIADHPASKKEDKPVEPEKKGCGAAVVGLAAALAASVALGTIILFKRKKEQ